MGEEREGPDATPQTREAPYPEPAKPASRWSREVRRGLHGRNKAVVTPRGVYASASQAADAFGFSRAHAARLARGGLQGWRWFVHGVDEGKPRKVRGAKSNRRPAPPHARRVFTPQGTFASATLAGLAHGITRQAAARRARENVGGWSYEPYDLT